MKGLLDYCYVEMYTVKRRANCLSDYCWVRLLTVGLLTRRNVDTSEHSHVGLLIVGLSPVGRTVDTADYCAPSADGQSPSHRNFLSMSMDALTIENCNYLNVMQNGVWGQIKCHNSGYRNQQIWLLLKHSVRRWNLFRQLTDRPIKS